MPVLLLPVLWMVVELVVIILVAGGIGALATIGLLILAGVAGVLLIRGQQMTMLAQMAASGGQRPDEMREGGFRVFAGMLLIIPGFVSDAIALIFLIRPLRMVFGALLLKIFSPWVERAAVYREYRGNIYEHEGDSTPQAANDEAPRVLEGGVIKRDENS